MIDIFAAPMVHSFASNTYILSSDGECAIVDPSVPYSESYLRGRLKYILLTHAHFDHMLDIDEWVSATGATVVVSKYDEAALSDPYTNAYFLFTGKRMGYNGDAMTVDESDALMLGSDRIDVIALPGHTPGSVGYMMDNTLIVGDTVFAGGGYGRCDLPGGDFSLLSSSIKRILALNDDTELLCGHGEATTVREYKRYFRNF